MEKEEDSAIGTEESRGWGWTLRLRLRLRLLLRLLLRCRSKASDKVDDFAKLFAGPTGGFGGNICPGKVGFAWLLTGFCAFPFEGPACGPALLLRVILDDASLCCCCCCGCAPDRKDRCYVAFVDGFLGDRLPGVGALTTVRARMGLRYLKNGISISLCLSVCCCSLGSSKPALASGPGEDAMRAASSNSSALISSSSSSSYSSSSSSSCSKDRPTSSSSSSSPLMTCDSCSSSSCVSSSLDSLRHRFCLRIDIVYRLGFDFPLLLGWRSTVFGF